MQLLLASGAEVYNEFLVRNCVTSLFLRRLTAMLSGLISTMLIFGDEHRDALDAMKTLL